MQQNLCKCTVSDSITNLFFYASYVAKYALFFLSVAVAHETIYKQGQNKPYKKAKM